MELTRRSFFARSAGMLGVAGAALALDNCGGPGIIDLLNDPIEDGSELLDIAFPQYAALLSPYITQLTTFADEVTTELASTDSVTQKIAVIVQDAGKVIAPNLFSLPQSLITRLTAIAQLVPQIVTLVQQLQAAIEQTPGGANAFFAAHHTKMPSAKAIAKTKEKNAALKAKLAAAKPHAELVCWCGSYHFIEAKCALVLDKPHAGWRPVPGRFVFPQNPILSASERERVNFAIPYRQS